jgi:peptidoglycan/xylan/chitin deacetylase (PgdA/CDA1 family)
MEITLPPLTVLLYHNILPSTNLQPSDKGSISIDRLAEHIRSLTENGFEIVSLDKIFGLLATKDYDASWKGYAITFDDAMEGVGRFLPELGPEIVKAATVFVITSYVGQQNWWNTRTSQISSHMTLSMLGELQAQGVNLQLHGIDHHNLTKFSVKELDQRFAAGAAWFEETMTKKPQYLAYPYGAYNNEVESAARQYFEGALSVNHGFWWGSEARWGLNRISVPNYLRGQDLVEILCTPPSERWLETEKRAPWWQSRLRK